MKQPHTHSLRPRPSRRLPIARAAGLTFALALALALPMWPDPLAADEAPATPNLLFIYLDDFGWRDTSFMGSDFYQTPNIDRLAAAGMVFTDAYSPAANCAPARAALMSGQYSPRHQVYNVGTGPRGPAAHRRLLHIPGTDRLDPDITTWASLLQDAGYRTAIMGKWHLGDDPLPHGFDVNIGGTRSGSPPRGYYPPHPNAPGLADVPDGEYLTDTLNRLAVEFIVEQADRPWALYLSHFAVHTPLDPRHDLVPKYEALPAGELHNHVAMATMIEAVDQGIGLIDQALDRAGVRDRTIIVFSSDNGGYGPATSMAPLRGSKGMYYEGGIRVPQFIVWPGVIEPGTRTSVPVHGVDFYPTFCEMFDLDPPAGHLLDGVSLVPLLRGSSDAAEALAERPLFWHFPAYLQNYGSGQLEQRDPLFRTRPCAVVRRGDWKLHECFETGDLELYNLADDKSETTNLAPTHPDKAAELHAMLKDWREQTGAPVPTEPNPEFDPEEEAQATARILRRLTADQAD